MRLNAFLLFGKKYEMWRILKPGGIFFARLASTIGMEQQVTLMEGRRYHLPDGSVRFLVDEAMLKRVTAEVGGESIEPNQDDSC